MSRIVRALTVPPPLPPDVILRAQRYVAAMALGYEPRDRKELLRALGLPLERVTP